jgi:hypothetical protein
MAKAGAPWRDLPERYGPLGTAATRFYRWSKAGLWVYILAELQRIADARGRMSSQPAPTGSDSRRPRVREMLFQPTCWSRISAVILENAGPPEGSPPVLFIPAYIGLDW